jgi:6-phosphogluconolactonase
MKEFIEYPDAEMMMLDLANTLAGSLKMVLQTHDAASLCVPGGSTPGPIYDSLCAADLDWARVTVFLNDERWVPESAPRSNTAMLMHRLLVGRAAAATVAPLYMQTDTPEEALEELSAGLAAHLPISVLLLGMGADMHTASLFPGADQLEAALRADAPALMAMRAPGAPEPRVTLTAPVLAGAMETHIVITGPEKRAALERARSLTPLEAPVALVLPNATVHWAP